MNMFSEYGPCRSQRQQARRRSAPSAAEGAAARLGEVARLQRTPALRWGARRPRMASMPALGLVDRATRASGSPSRNSTLRSRGFLKVYAKGAISLMSTLGLDPQSRHQL